MKLSRVSIVCAFVVMAVSACSGLKTREEVKQNEAAAAQVADEGAPIDDEAINDGLAEMGVDPHESTTETTDAEAATASPTPVPEPTQMATTSNPRATGAKKSVTKKKVVRKKSSLKKTK